jgi:hypothetical protein
MSVGTELKAREDAARLEQIELYKEQVEKKYNINDMLGFPYDVVMYKNELIGLSPGLMLKQNITKEQFDGLIDCHKRKIDFYQKDFLLSIELELLTEIEYKSQELWGFPRDAKFHYWTLQHPKCECPKMDNNERVGATDTRIVVKGCPVHDFQGK